MSDLGVTSVNGVNTSLDGLIEEFRAMSEAEITQEGKAATAQLLVFLNNAGIELDKGVIAVLNAACQACMADGVFHPKEKKLVDDILKEFKIDKAFDMEEIYKLIQGPVDTAFVERIANLDLNVGIYLSRLMMAFVAIDGEIDAKEEKMIKKIFEETYEKFGMMALFAALTSVSE